MTEDDRSELRAAAKKLGEARNHANGDATDRLATFAEQVEKMASGGRGPDHGRLARLEHGLQDVRSDLDSEGAEAVTEALAHVRAYRETVEGV